MQLSKAISPRSLPKLTNFRPGRVLKDLSPDSGFSRLSPDCFFSEIEKKVNEQRQEIINRDVAVKKVIYNFESILEAHNSQKMRTNEIREKYKRSKKEVLDLRAENKRLNEIIKGDPDYLKKQQEENSKKIEEENTKKQIENFKQVIETKNQEILEKNSRIYSLENERELLQKEIGKIFGLAAKHPKEDFSKYAKIEVKELVEKNVELEKNIVSKDENLRTARNQISYLKEAMNTLEAELKIAKHQANVTKRNFERFKAAQTAQELKTKTRISEEEQSKSSLAQTEDHLNVGVSQNEDHSKSLNSSFSEIQVNTHDQLIGEKLSLLKEIQELSETNIQLKENEMLQNLRLKHLEKEVYSLRELASTYKRKFEDSAVESSHLKETLSYKDEKIRRDNDIIRHLRTIEPETIVIKKNIRDLEDAYKNLSFKNGQLLENAQREKEKWLIKEQGYFDTINSLVKEVNLSKNKEDSPFIGNHFETILQFEIELKNIRKELEDTQKKNEELTEKNDSSKVKLEHIEFLLGQTDQITKCCSCFSSGKAVNMIIPCYHLICTDCQITRCKECFSPVKKIIQPGFTDSLIYLLSQVRLYTKSTN